ncbi:MAG: hypothetical protein KDJ65_08040, partial [Anaerolineae bacterium]|nr:hypothetical protein [Anaerolineae bacterium]
MAHSSSPKTKRLPPLFLMMAGVMLVLLTLTLGNRPPSVWANATKVPANPEPTRPPGEEIRAHTIISPADCTQNPYRQS